jgi:hypothetical protein
MAVAAVAVLAEQRNYPHKTPWYPWVLTAGRRQIDRAQLRPPRHPLDPPPLSLP